MYIQNADNPLVPTQMTQYLRNTDLDLFYIAPNEDPSEAARNTTWQLTDEELHDVRIGNGRVGLRLETPNYKMVEIRRPDPSTVTIPLLPLFPKPAIQFFDPNYGLIREFYLCDASVPDMEMKDEISKVWLELKGSYNKPYAHSVLLGGKHSRKYYDTRSTMGIDSSCIKSEGLEWRLGCVATTELFLCHMDGNTQVAHLMRYLAVNGVEYSVALEMASTILMRFSSTEVNDEGWFQQYLELQAKASREDVYEVFEFWFDIWFVDSLDKWLGYIAPELPPEE
jgi:hypothetical protein